MRTKTFKITNSCALLKLFGKWGVVLPLDTQRRNDVTSHNERMKKNGWLLRRLIDAVCSLASRDFPFRGQDESSTSLNKENFAEYLDVLKNHRPLLKKHLNSVDEIQFKIEISYWFNEIFFANIQIIQKLLLKTKICYLFIFCYWVL